MKLKRLKEMEAFIREQRACSLEQLTGKFQVSLSTIRRDLGDLVAGGTVARAHGGVKYLQPGGNVLQDRRPELLDYRADLDRVAAAASRLVEDGDNIILGSGYTVSHMVRHLRDRKNLTVVTNNVLVLAEAIGAGFETIVVGGAMKADTLSIIGLDTDKTLNRINAHKAFLGANGLTSAARFTTSDNLEAEMKKAMMKAARQRFILADHSKFGQVSLYTFADFEDVDAVVTDLPPAEEFSACFQQNHIRLILASAL